jgi:hypothetical protein
LLAGAYPRLGPGDDDRDGTQIATIAPAFTAHAYRVEGEGRAHDTLDVDQRPPSERCGSRQAAGLARRAPAGRSGDAACAGHRRRGAGAIMTERRGDSVGDLPTVRPG